MIMNFLEFILSFCLLSLVGSAAIYGFYLCSRGEWIITPDGKYKKTGMIFKYWSLFWEQYRKTKWVYYDGKALEEKYVLLGKTLPAIAKKLRLVSGSIIAFSADITAEDVKLIENTLLCRCDWNKERLLLSTEEPVYDWPEWIQKPLSSCATCMAGPYGTIMWVVFLNVSRGTFSWSDKPIFCEIVFGMLFLLTLSCLNTIFHKMLKF